MKINKRKMGQQIDALIAGTFPLGARRKTLRHLLRIAAETIAINEFRYRMAAVGFSEKGQIFVGVPRDKTHPIMKHYPKSCKCLHAESDLLLKAGEGALSVVVVMRIHKKNWSFRLAKPCESCEMLLRRFHPDARVFYTTNEQTLERVGT